MTLLSPSSAAIAQLRLALARREHTELPGNTRASVALILRLGETGLELLVIRRASRDGDPWSGHMGLPGGRREPGDLDNLQTAVRETEEELGVNLWSFAELLGSLSDNQASANGQVIDLVISAFVFLVGASPSLAPNHEVAEVLWAPISALADGSSTIAHQVILEGQQRVLPGWSVEGRVIWGLTYRIVSNLLRQLRE